MTVPVTVLSGTLGAGKTTVLNHLLTRDHGYEAAVLVNDVGEVNVDADLIERRVEDREVVELSNGCICCGIGDEFERELVDLALAEEFEYLLVEPSGISEPEPVARRFVRSRAAPFYDLSSLTTVVDARQFCDAFGDGDVARREEDANTNDLRPLSDLIVDGLEFCDTIVVNKTDLVNDRELEYALESIRAVQPAAELLATEFGRVDPGELLDTGRFDAETVSGSSAWKRALERHRNDRNGDEGVTHADHADHDHVHPPEEYGIDSFVYRCRRPMHPERLAEALGEPREDLVRAKGYLHVAGRPDHALTLSLAGPRSRIEVAGRWIASLPEDRREFYRRSRRPEWDEEYGDRKTELVLIGRGTNRERLERTFDDCRATETELEDDPTDLENPFPTREGEVLRL
jgi:G3E family GTPase